MKCESCGKDMTPSGIGWDKEQFCLYWSEWCLDCEELYVFFSQYMPPPKRMVRLMGDPE